MFSDKQDLNIISIQNKKKKKPDLRSGFLFTICYAKIALGSTNATGEPSFSSNVAHSQAS